ncbi:MAG: capsule biosynthesis protein CapC [Gammaproteobacteria bacterium]|nr:capsule biosynthesis protein CapC [Gammaproteobacteria bacterium]
MIDLHCHILPGIDDGASDLTESLALLQLAVADGITRMVATPHINPGYFDNTQASIHQALTLLRTALNEQKIAISIAAAAEIRVTADLMPAFESGQLPILGHWQQQQVLLLEFPHSHIPPGSDKLVKWLSQRGVIPMIAHPERNRDVQNDPKILAPLIRAGCLFQLTASSLLGDLGSRHQDCARVLLEQRLFTVMATDSHNVLRRPPRLATARAEVSRLTDESYAHALVQGNPQVISASLDFSAA